MGGSRDMRDQTVISFNQGADWTPISMMVYVMVSWSKIVSKMFCCWLREPSIDWFLAHFHSEKGGVMQTPQETLIQKLILQQMTAIMPCGSWGVRLSLQFFGVWWSESSDGQCCSSQTAQDEAPLGSGAVVFSLCCAAICEENLFSPLMFILILHVFTAHGRKWQIEKIFISPKS